MINFLWLFSRKNKQSYIFLCHAQIINEKIEIISDIKLALSPSKPGYFDSKDC